MSVHNSACNLRRCGFTWRTLSKPSKRLLSSRRPEPYVLPRLVIDLDATDNTFVKSYEEMTVEEQNQSLPIPRQVHKPNYIAPRPAESWKRHQTNASRETSASPSDLLSFALLGEQSSTHMRGIKRSFRIGGAHPMDDLETKIKVLAETFVLQELDKVECSGPLKGIAGVDQCDVWADLSRLVSDLSTTQEGCRILATHGTNVVQAIRNCRKKQWGENGQRVSHTMVLRMLNNLQLAMASKDVRIGPAICNAGLYYASIDPVLPAVRMYLEISTRNGYPSGVHVGRAATNLLQRIYFGTKAQNNPDILDNSLRNELLRIVTGDIWPHPSASRGQRSLSIASILYRDIWLGFDVVSPASPYHRYITALGLAKLSGIISAEFEYVRASLSAIWNESQYSKIISLFAQSFTQAEGLDRAISLLQNGNRVQIAQELYQALAPTIYQYLRMKRIQLKKQLSERIISEFEYNRDDPERMLRLFETYLLLDYNEDARRGPMAILDYAQVDGQYGLLLESIEGQHLYFKATS